MPSFLFAGTTDMQTWKKRDVKRPDTTHTSFGHTPLPDHNGKIKDEYLFHLMNPSQKLTDWLNKKYPLVEIKKRAVKKRPVEKAWSSWNEPEPLEP